MFPSRPASAHSQLWLLVSCLSRTDRAMLSLQHLSHLGKRECRHLLGRHLLSVAASQVPGTRHRAEPRQRNGLLGAPGRGESQLETSAGHGPPRGAARRQVDRGVFLVWELALGLIILVITALLVKVVHTRPSSLGSRGQISETHSGLVRPRQMHLILCLLLGRSRVCGFRSSYQRKATSNIQTPKMSTLK